MKTKLFLLLVLFGLPLAAQQINQEEGMKKSSFIPKYVISTGAGYGYLLNRAADGVDKKLYDELRSGLDWNVAFYRYYKNYLGWGVLCEGFYSKTDVDDNNKITDRLTYFAPQFSAMIPFNDRWSLHVEAGIGLLSYKETGKGNNIKYKATAHTVGMNYGVGMGYNLNRNLAITFNLNMLGGVFDSGDWAREITGEDEWGAVRINTGIGLRWRFW